MVEAMAMAVETETIEAMEVAIGRIPTLAMEAGVVAVAAVVVAEETTGEDQGATVVSVMATLLLIVQTMLEVPVWQQLLLTPMRLC